MLLKYFKPSNGTLQKVRQLWRHNLNYQGIRKFSSQFKMTEHIVWMDMEMTGLDIDKDTILEVACLVTNNKLEIISSTFSQVIHHNEETLSNMNDWCKKVHKESGLVDKVKKSKVSHENVQEELLKFIKTYVKVPSSAPLAGNSIWMDRLFLRKYMPTVDEYLHYRIIDVSTVKELTRMWKPNVASNVPCKKLCHRALDDIQESIEELKYYRSNIFDVSQGIK